MCGKIYGSLLQNIVSFTGLFCKRDLIYCCACWHIWHEICFIRCIIYVIHVACLCLFIYIQFYLDFPKIARWSGVFYIWNNYMYMYNICHQKKKKAKTKKRRHRKGGLHERQFSKIARCPGLFYICNKITCICIIYVIQKNTCQRDLKRHDHRAILEKHFQNASFVYDCFWQKRPTNLGRPLNNDLEMMYILSL